MYRAFTVAVALSAILCASAGVAAPIAPAAPPGALIPDALTPPVDADCMKTLSSAAQQAHKTNSAYLAALKSLKENPYASGAASVCNSAMARADQYFKKNVAAAAVCTSGSAYSDGQVVHLFKNSTITCRSETANVVNRLAPDEQSTVMGQLRQQGADLR